MQLGESGRDDEDATAHVIFTLHIDVMTGFPWTKNHGFSGPQTSTSARPVAPAADGKQLSHNSHA